jgi:hypothetical protein
MIDPCNVTQMDANTNRKPRGSSGNPRGCLFQETGQAGDAGLNALPELRNSGH